MNTKKKRGALPRYDQAFKTGAIRLVTEQGKPCSEVARELEAENRALRKQISEKDEVINVLKKSVGILSKP